VSSSTGDRLPGDGFGVDTDGSNVGVKEVLSQYGMDRTTVNAEQI
jgi:hypothetical protein